MGLAVIFHPGLETFYHIEDNKFEQKIPYQIGEMLPVVYRRAAYLDQHCL